MARIFMEPRSPNDVRRRRNHGAGWLARHPALTCASLVLLAGCGSLQVPAQSAAPRAQPASCGDACTGAVRALTPRVYISDEDADIVAIFSLKGKSLGTISSGLNYPQGIFVDAGHNLWVANRGSSNILMFERGATVPSQELRDPNGQPQDVTMCPDGSIYVANILANGGEGNVAVYSPGKTKPARTLAYGGGNFFYITCDAAGNVFTSLVLGTGGTVVEFPHGRQAGALVLPISTAGNPGAIKVDPAGNLLFNDAAGSVTEYTESGTPTGVSIAYGGAWVDFALTQAGTTILGADSANRQGVSLTFPGGAPVTTYSSKLFSTPIGAAFDPEYMAAPM